MLIAYIDQITRTSLRERRQVRLHELRYVCTWSDPRLWSSRNDSQSSLKGIDVGPAPEEFRSGSSGGRDLMILKRSMIFIDFRQSRRRVENKLLLRISTALFLHLS